MISELYPDIPSNRLGDYMQMLQTILAPEMAKQGIRLGMDPSAAGKLLQLQKKPGDVNALLFFAGFASFDHGISQARFGIDIDIAALMAEAADNRKHCSNLSMINKISAVTTLLHMIQPEGIQAGRIEPESSEWITDMQGVAFVGHRIYFTMQVALSYP